MIKWKSNLNQIEISKLNTRSSYLKLVTQRIKFIINIKYHIFSQNILSISWSIYYSLYFLYNIMGKYSWGIKEKPIVFNITT